MIPHRLARHVVGVASLFPMLALAQQPPKAPPSRPDSTRRNTVTTLGGMQVTADRDTRSTLTTLTLPATAGVTRTTIDATVNVVDPQDALKYLPTLFVRKRNNGDTQATLATRVWGVSSSARSLVFADGVPLTALIANNNTIGGPRWGQVAPEEIARMDVMYGPFSAAYAGNAIGAVVDIATRLPTRTEGSVTQTQTFMPFSLYGTQTTYGTTQTSARVGTRWGRVALVLSGNYADSHSQPLTYVTAATFPAGTTGGYTANNKLNQAANVLGATGLLHTRMLNARAKVAVDLTASLQAVYSIGAWRNDGNATAQTFLAKAGDPSYAGQSGFASGSYGLLQAHTSQSLTLRTQSLKDWDVEAVATDYRMDTDRQRFPTTAPATGLTFASAGRVAVLSGTGWRTGDIKAAWHRGGLDARHVVSVGAHADQYRLQNPTLATADWQVADPVTTSVVSSGVGSTQTLALWAQEQWRLSPAWQMTMGARYEQWRAFDGVNVNGTVTVQQPARTLRRVSPKLSLAWTDGGAWRVTGSVAQAYRFATAAELFQLVTTGSTFTAPEPNLRPDNVLATELRAVRTLSRGSVQVALFQDNIRDAILSQFQTLVPGSSTLYSYLSNIDRVSARGAEVAGSGQDLLVTGLDLQGSVTYVDARTRAMSGRASATATPDAAIGKQLPNIPTWRFNGVATYRATPRLSVSLAGRYSGALWTTLDNTDVNPNVYQGFSAWFVADARARWQITPHIAASAGVDNLLNRQYFLFHPFPQRTWHTSLSVTY